jgi:hypothetical protein
MILKKLRAWIRSLDRRESIGGRLRHTVVVVVVVVMVVVIVEIPIVRVIAAMISVDNTAGQADKTKSNQTNPDRLERFRGMQHE